MDQAVFPGCYGCLVAMPAKGTLTLNGLNCRVPFAQNDTVASHLAGVAVFPLLACLLGHQTHMFHLAAETL